MQLYTWWCTHSCNIFHALHLGTSAPALMEVFICCNYLYIRGGKPMMLLIFALLILWIIDDIRPAVNCADRPAGSWELVVSNAGVSAMHMALMHTNKVLIFDRTDYGPSVIRLPNGRCRNDSHDRALKIDCWAHSVELDLSNFSIRPLEILTDTWCSSGAFTSNGTMLQTGGFNDGSQTVRLFTPCDDGSCDWVEKANNSLSVSRWYASNQILPDDRVVVVGGRRAFSYEFFPKTVSDQRSVHLPFLVETNAPAVENNLYPFLHLSSDGNLFIFANRDSMLLDYKAGNVVRRFPTMPGGSRSYPSSGSSVMLPLSYSDGFQSTEVLVCGGAPEGSFPQANGGVFRQADNTCGRINIINPNSTWEMEEMPSPRVMGDHMIILPTKEIMIINGAEEGTAGWGLARKPALNPLLYKPTAIAGERFEILNGSNIPRLYHSTAVLLPDGKVLVAGSNPNVGYSFGTEALYPTELRIETYSPYYLNPAVDPFRPTDISLSNSTLSYNSTALIVQFSVGQTLAPTNLTYDWLDYLQIMLYGPPFTTHSYSMNQRLLTLPFMNLGEAYSQDGTVGKYVVKVTAPPNPIVAPPGYYLLFVINTNVPGRGAWVQLIT